MHLPAVRCVAANPNKDMTGALDDDLASAAHRPFDFFANQHQFSAAPQELSARAHLNDHWFILGPLQAYQKRFVFRLFFSHSPEAYHQGKVACQ